MDEQVKNVDAEQPLDSTIVLNKIGVENLKSIIKWSTIYVYVGYIFLGVIFLNILFAGKMLEKLIYLTGQQIQPDQVINNYMIYISGIATMIIYFYPLFSLQKFQQKAKCAIEQNDEVLLAESLSKQGLFFKILACYGIISLFFLSMFVLGALMIFFLVN